MRFDIMTLFPEFVDGILNESIIGRARKSGSIEVYCHNIRDYSTDKHRRVDDTPYGGGKGMLMMAPPVYDCYSAIKNMLDEGNYEKRKVVFMSPAGKVFDQKKAEELAELDSLIILCGHYEGIDQRVLDEIVDEEISIGDFVLTGGELPACLVTDAVARLVDGVLSDSECHMKESISSGMLEYPQYTRPFEFHGVSVPEVLISGNHANIDAWRNEQAKKRTIEKRPDILENFGREVGALDKK